jgi:hypothetical protein
MGFHVESHQFPQYSYESVPKDFSIISTSQTGSISTVWNTSTDSLKKGDVVSTLVKVSSGFLPFSSHVFVRSLLTTPWPWCLDTARA